MVSKKDEFNFLPEGLPTPEDDGACDHLLGMELPSVELESTSGDKINPSATQTKFTVIFVYPTTGNAKNKTLIENEEEWNSIPGACGCTSQTCGYRDSIEEFTALNTTVYGLSNNTPDYQLEAKERLELDFDLLSDHQMEFANALKLPTFTFHDMSPIKRVTMIAQGSKIVKVFYPIFPPNNDASHVLTWLKKNQ